jgi:DNA polymerase-3 subunit gamma/tau
MKFSDLVGQESVTKAIGNAIKLGREPHAVIFSGVRGIGKTTTARLYAKALNCEDTSSTEPCNECTSCEAITKGIHEDVIEIDGASNNGVDEIRSIRESVSYIPQRSKYKVYIIDEVHMLSTSAFNALLKTLEEPPAHVVFVFATTELQKVPQTVIGRCQTFYLQKIRLNTMADRIAEILDLENIKYEQKAISLVAREGHGSMRDALSFLDQSIALGGGEVTLEGVSQLTANLSAAPYIELLSALVAREAEKVLSIVEKLDEEGQAFRDVCEETAKVSRHGFVVRDLGKEHIDIALLGLEDQDVERLSEIAASSSPMDLNRIFRTLIKCLSDMDGSSLDRFIFENYMLEWCVDPGLPSIEELMGGNGLNIGSSQNRTHGAVSAMASAPVQASSQPVTARPKKSLMASFAEVKSGEQKKKIAKEASEVTPSVAPEVTSTSTVSALASEKKVKTTLSNASESASNNVSSQKVIEKQAASTEVKSIQRSNNEARFPESWRALVDAWKAQKPLQARKLEEVHPIEYGMNKIVVAVDPKGIVGPALLKRETQIKIATAFRELFGFSGDFSAIPREGAAKILEKTMPETGAEENLPETSIAQDIQEEAKEIESQCAEGALKPEHVEVGSMVESFESEAVVGGATSNDQILPASILQQKKEEIEEKRANVLAEAKDAPITQHMQAALNVELGKVEITDPALL